MPKECAAAECSETQTKNSDLSFHHFPSDSRLKQEWAVKMNRLDPNTKKLWKPGPHDVLCSRHFEPSCFTLRTLLSREEGIAYSRMQFQQYFSTALKTRENGVRRLTTLDLPSKAQEEAWKEVRWQCVY
ncbi:hypothetical protein V1264_014264 [Littorina saxatilis]|uniref:THAP-type domain-containing protein n=1 Tax=Littorina saxatilis TaxID=31220 RepID=A0AAN9BVF0_9CAEN